MSNFFFYNTEYKKYCCFSAETEFRTFLIASNRRASRSFDGPVLGLQKRASKRFRFVDISPQYFGTSADTVIQVHYHIDSVLIIRVCTARRRQLRPNCTVSLPLSDQPLFVAQPRSLMIHRPKFIPLPPQTSSAPRHCSPQHEYLSRINHERERRSNLKSSSFRSSRSGHGPTSARRIQSNTCRNDGLLQNLA